MEYAKSALNEYKSVEIDAAVLAATPHELIAKLLSKAIQSLHDAKEHLQSNNIAGKGQCIKFAITIIADGLRSSLNLDAGGEIAANLDALYDYMVRRLMTAHAQNNPELLDEVIQLLQQIKSGWDGIKP